MNKTIKTVIALIAAISLAVPCFAEISYKYSVDDAKKTITVTVSGAEKNQNIIIEVLKPGKEIKETYTKEDIISDFVIMAQAPANAGGEREFFASLEGVESGDLTIRINKEIEDKIFYASSFQKAELIANIITLCEGDVSAAKEGLSRLLEIGNPGQDAGIAMKILMLTDTSEMLFKVSAKDLLYEALYNIAGKEDWNLKGLSEEEIEELTLSEDGLGKISADIEKMLEALRLAADIEGINENLLNIIDKKDVFALNEKYFLAYEEKLSEEEKQDFTENYYKGKNYLTQKEISEAFNGGILHSLCSGLDAWGDVEYIIETFGDDIGISMDTFKSDDMTSSKRSKLYSFVLENTYDDIEDFKDAVNKKMDELTEDDGSKGFGGGSGGSKNPGGSGNSSGGSSFGGGGMGITAPITPSLVKDEEPDDDEKAENEEVFSDLYGFEWASESINALYKEGIIEGMGDGRFEPSRNVSREEMLAMLFRAYNMETSEENLVFSDMAEGEWYVPYIAAAKEAGIILGNTDGTFGIGSAITREDAAVMAYRIAVLNGKELSGEITEEFKDENLISGYAKEAVYALKNSGVLKGTGAGDFEPKAACSRAEAAEIIYKLLNNI